MQHQVLLLKDLPSGDRKGQIVKVKSGHARNFLIPYGFAVAVDKRTIRLQERLKVEREQQAAVDRKEATAMADKIKEMSFSVVTKVDPDGHMYGSVNAGDIVKLFEEQGLSIERRFVRIGGPLRTLGKHTIPLVLKEGVEAFATLEIKPDRVIEKKREKKAEPKPEEQAEAGAENAATETEEPSEG